MIAKLKTLALSLLALGAIGAVSAASASAATRDVITVGASPALLTGVSHNHVFKADPGNLEFRCTTSKFAATVKNGDTHLTLDVEYEGTLEKTPHTEKDCNGSPGNITVDTNGCTYTINGDTTGVDSAGKADATVWILCPEGKQIQFTSSLGVTLSMPPQTPTKGGVALDTIASHFGNSALNITFTMTGITTTCAPAFSCGLAGIPTHSNAYEYIGNVIMTAFKDDKGDGLPTPVIEGERTSLTDSVEP